MGLLDSLFGGTSQSKQKRRFSPEAKQALQREVPVFLQIAPLLNSLMQGVLQPEGGVVGAGVQRAAASTQPTVETAGIAAGLDVGTLADILTELDPADPAFQDILRQLSRSVATSVPAVVDPRFAVGLRPTTDTRTTTTPSPFAVFQGVGQLGLGAAALAGGGCWVALRLYGPNDLRFYLARFWVCGGLRRTRSGRVLAWLYRRTGRTLARSGYICRALKPVMDRAWHHGLQEVCRHG